MTRLSFRFLLLFNLLFCSSMAQKKTAPLADSSTVSLRSFDTTALTEFRADRDFRYGEMEQGIARTLWDRAWIWVWDLFHRLVSGTKSAGFFGYVFIVLGCAALILLVIKLSGMNPGYLFIGKSKEVEISYKENLENIHQISFDEAVNTALQNYDYRLAVRILYLKSLKRLSDTGKIIWQPEKTNRTYISELKDPSQQARFKLLTQRFEYVWYGSFPVDLELYTKISHAFNEFHSSR